MKDHLNARVKHREAFRPFAPIAMQEHAAECFDADFPVPYMLFNTSVRESVRAKLPAITHADGSGRLQTVSRDDTPLLHTLLAEIRRRDGVGVLLNTSFNDNGEPIVETVEDAVRCFRGTNIDALVCGDAVLEKSA
jgi:carbamoyltransferase